MPNEVTKELVRKEVERTDFALSELTIASKKNTQLHEWATDFLTMIKAYSTDALFFYQKGKYVEALELFSYLWGYLDAGARIGLFDTGKARKHYKIDQ